jgi:hypothetical protein
VPPTITIFIHLSLVTRNLTSLLENLAERFCSAIGYFTGISGGAPLSLTKKTTNLAGLVLLAFRPTTCTSLGPS